MTAAWVGIVTVGAVWVVPSEIVTATAVWVGTV